MDYVSPYKEISGLNPGYEFKDVLDVFAATKTTDSAVFKSNGLESDGWSLLTTLRHRLEGDLATAGLPFVVVTTKTVKARFVGAKPKRRIDLMQRRGEKVLYWWEFDKAKMTVVKDRQYIEGFEAEFYNVDENEAFIAIIGTKDLKYDEVVELLKSGDLVELSGMWVTASVDKKEQTPYMIVNGFTVQKDDFSSANNILASVKEWQQLIPMRNITTGQPMFPETVMLSMMMAALFYREGSPALNAVYFGPPYTGKSVALDYLTRNIMKGSFEAATASSGKGWLVTHKEGVSSKIFVERRVMLVDEFFKAASTVGAKANYHSFALELNHFMMRHMQLLERKEVDATSGLGTVKGRMRCAFIATENDDETLQKALAKADSMSGGPLRRFQFAYVDKPNKDERFKVRQDPGAVARYMTSYFIRHFGRTALKDLGNLYMASRRISSDASLNAPEWWQEAMMQSFAYELEKGSEDIPTVYLPEVDREKTDKKMAKLTDYIEHHGPCLNACWVSAAIIRGWEVYDTLDELQPVFDAKQQRMAEEVSRYFFLSKLRVLAPGMSEVFEGPAGIGRTIV